MKNRSAIAWFVLLMTALLLCCCASAGLVGSYLLITSQVRTIDRPTAIHDAITVVIPAPELTATPSVARDVSRRIPMLDAESAGLLAAEMPAADVRALGLRLQDPASREQPAIDEIPLVVNAIPPSYEVGDRQQFWVANSDVLEHRRITAELKVMTEHLAMWVEQGVRLNQDDLAASADRFEQQTYPTVREFFGSEWTPGVDNDPRLHILHARGLGQSTAGYYSSADEYSRRINEYSNEREMFYISAEPGVLEPNTAFYDGTLAHEFQHMVHWFNDANEDSWVNEGMSQLASYLNGFEPGGFDFAYAQQPDTQLTTWGDPSESNAEYYGAAYLFVSYFLDRFGEDLTKAVVASPKNGILGFDEALSEAGLPERFDDVFADWAIANYLDAPEAHPDGRYGYEEIDLYPMSVAEIHRRYLASGQGTVNQYAVDYIRLRGKDALQISFEGQAEAPLVDAPLVGSRSWWSNRGDEGDSTLTRAFDLTEVKSARLDFSVWYDIEESWDYAYVQASTDGGRRWQALEGRYTTDENPSGNSFGHGWTGISGNGDRAEWVEESVDLTPFAGREVLLRFEMVTDASVNEPGMLVDDIAIRELGYLEDGEAGDGGWESDGWILIDNSVAQRWLVQLLEIGAESIGVRQLEVSADGRGELALPALENRQEAILLVSALAPVTTEPATYRYTIERR